MEEKLLIAVAKNICMKQKLVSITLVENTLKKLEVTGCNILAAI